MEERRLTPKTAARIRSYLNFSLPAGEIFIVMGVLFLTMNHHPTRARITQKISGTRANRGPRIKREKNTRQEVTPRPRPAPRLIVKRNASFIRRGKKI
jgi:hypothetical protein